MKLFRNDNTTEYSADQLAELNARWEAQHAELDPDTDEGKHASERLLSAFDSE